MINVILIGSGAVAAEVCSIINDINSFSNNSINISGFIDIDQNLFDANSIKYSYKYPLLGSFNNFEIIDNVKYILCFSNIQNRQRFLDLNRHKKIKFINIIHPSSIISKSAILGDGNIIYPNCVIGPGAKIGNYNLLTSYSFISHDCVVGNNNFLSTSGLSGNVKLGNNNYFGIRVTIIPEVQIGSNNIIQAGMIIDKNITDNETIFYKFKERISIIKQ